MVLVCHPQHPLAQQRSVDARDAARRAVRRLSSRASRFARRSIARSRCTKCRRARRAGVRQHRNDQAGDRNRRRHQPAARADDRPRDRLRHAGSDSARRRAARAAAGHHSSPRPQAERNGPAIHPVAAIASGADRRSQHAGRSWHAAESNGHPARRAARDIAMLRPERNHRLPELVAMDNSQSKQDGANSALSACRRSRGCTTRRSSTIRAAWASSRTSRASGATRF